MSILTFTTDVLPWLEASGNSLSTAQKTVLTTELVAVEAAIKKYLGFGVEQATVTEYYPDRMANVAGDVDDVMGGGSWDVLGGQVVGRTRGDRWQNALMLRHVPVRSITSVYENLGAWNTAGGSFPSGTLLPTNAYYLDIQDDTVGSMTGALYRISGVWPHLPRVCKITYVHGYTSGEIDTLFPEVKAAIRHEMGIVATRILQLSRMIATGPVSSVSIEDFSTSFDLTAEGGMMGFSGKLSPRTTQLLSKYVNVARYF